MNENGIMLGMGILIILLLWMMVNSDRKLAELKFQKQSQSVKYGQMSEQFMPFMKSYPYDSQNFKFLGMPIDGIQFEKDSIVFIEFKIGSSKLSDKQKHIKNLIQNGNVSFKEVRI